MGARRRVCRTDHPLCVFEKVRERNLISAVRYQKTPTVPHSGAFSCGVYGLPLGDGGFTGNSYGMEIYVTIAYDVNWQIATEQILDFRLHCPIAYNGYPWNPILVFTRYEHGWFVLTLSRLLDP